jgi:hypothetical protein
MVLTRLDYALRSSFTCQRPTIPPRSRACTRRRLPRRPNVLGDPARVLSHLLPLARGQRGGGPVPILVRSTVSAGPWLSPASGCLYHLQASGLDISYACSYPEVMHVRLKIGTG